MADSKDTSKNKGLDIDSQHWQMRTLLSDSYSFVLGQEYTKTAATVSIEQLIDEGIHRLEGTTSRKSERASRLDRILQIKNSITSAVTALKAQDISKWKRQNAPDASNKANTKE
jgi:hypothetical protein